MFIVISSQIIVLFPDLSSICNIFVSNYKTQTEMKRLLAMSATAMMMSAAAMAAPGAGAAKSDSLSLLSPDKKLELNFYLTDKPDKKLELNFYLTDKGEPFYSLKFNGQNVIDDSRLGFDIRHEGGVSDIQPFMNGWEVKESNTVLRPSQMREGFILDSTARTTVDYTWEPVWGEEKEIRDHHNELAVYLRQPMSSAFGTETDEDRMIVIRFRLFNDGLGFRYEHDSHPLPPLQRRPRLPLRVPQAEDPRLLHCPQRTDRVHLP